MYHRKLTRFAAGAAIATLAAIDLHGSSAQADVPAGAWTIPTRNASDPFVVGCTVGSETYICMYTSSDMSSGGYTGNPYPMNSTYLYTLDKDLNPGTTTNWTDRGAILTENGHYSSWVPAGANHLWAPAMATGGDGMTYLYVPDVTDRGADGVHKTSQIGVSVAASPIGPFAYQKRITYNGSNLTGYMSDPMVMQTMGSFTEPNTGASRWLLWANGDYNTCGGLSIARLNDADMSSLISAPGEISFTVNGSNTLPSQMSSCTRSLPDGVSSGTPGYSGTVNHAYIEGAELYFMPPTGVTPHGDMFLLIMAIKPNSNPSGCSSSNEAIAYATSNDPRGPYTYRGIIMCGSSTEWTNQASILKYSDINGNSYFILFYHDAPSGDNPQNRKVRAECMTITNSGISTVNRSTNFSSCLPSGIPPFSFGNGMGVG